MRRNSMFNTLIRKKTEPSEAKESPKTINERFNGAYQFLIRDSMDSLAELLLQHKGKRFTKIPVGVGLLDIELGDEKFSYVFHFRNKQNEWETYLEEDYYPNLRYHLDSFFNIMENGYIHNDFGKDIQDHLEAFYGTFISLLDEEVKDGSLPFGDWTFYYGVVRFDMSRRISTFRDHRHFRTDSGIFVLGAKESDGTYDCGWGGGGAAGKVFLRFSDEEYNKKYGDLAIWERRINLFSEYL